MMIRLFVMLSVALLASSFQVGASTLKWESISGYGPSLGVLEKGNKTPQELYGSVAGLVIETNVLDKWTFILSETSDVSIKVNPLTSTAGKFLGSPILEDKQGVKREFHKGMNEIALFDGELRTGAYVITIEGITTSIDPLSGYEVSVSTLAQTPIPAAGWLFLSAMIGLLGASRSKRA
jgi:hypothetical protein